MLARLGSALILIGVVLMVIYLVTGTVGQGDLRLLLAGAACSVVGLFFRRRRPSPGTSARFRGLRRLLGGDEESDA
jgi:membrane-bound ClpP family serine protease